MITTNGERWYWLDTAGIAWVRANLPDAKIKRHRRLAFYQRGEWHERHEAGAVLFPRGGIARARKAGFKPQEANVETCCGACARTYIPHVQDDPCIAGLPGVKFACCGHGGQSPGYVTFENGVTVRFSGTAAISRRIDWSGESYKAVNPCDPRYWQFAKGHQED